MHQEQQPGDQWIRTKLQGTQLPVNPELWARIESRIHPASRRQIKGWWIGTVVAVLTLMALGTVYFRKNNLYIHKTLAVPVRDVISSSEKPYKNSQSTGTVNPADMVPPDSKGQADKSGSQSSAFVENNKLSGNPAMRIALLREPSNRIKQLQTVSGPVSKISPATLSSVSLMEKEFPISPSATGVMTLSPVRIPLQNLNLIETILKPHELNCPTGERMPKTLFAELYSSLEYPVTIFSGHGSVPNLLDSVQSPLAGYSAGFRIGKELSNGLSISAGFHYSLSRQSFIRVMENERRLIQVITIRTIVRNPGDTVRLSDTSMITQTGTSTIRSVNSIQTIDLPLLLSYEWKQEKFSVALTGGPVFNFRSWYSGLQVDNNNSVVPLKTAQLRRSMGLGAIVMVQGLYRITPAVQLYAGPQMRYNFSSYTYPQAGYNARNHSLGLQMGIRFQLNNLRNQP